MKKHRTPDWILKTKPLRKNDPLETMLIVVLLAFLATATTLSFIVASH